MELNKELLKCSDIKLHNFTGLTDDDSCRWCKKSVAEIKENNED